MATSEQAGNNGDLDMLDKAVKQGWDWVLPEWVRDATAELRAARTAFEALHFKSFCAGHCVVCGHTWWGNRDDMHQPSCPIALYTLQTQGQETIFTPEVVEKYSYAISMSTEALAKLQADW